MCVCVCVCVCVVLAYANYKAGTQRQLEAMYKLAQLWIAN